MAHTTRISPIARPVDSAADAVAAALTTSAPTDSIRLVTPGHNAADKAVAKALGDELRRTRDEHGWSRAQFVTRLPSGIGERTLLAYEHGTRQLTVIRLIELCEALEVTAPDVLTLALQRARLHLEHLALQIDLRTMLNDKNNKFRPMHQWTRNRLNETPSGIAEVSPTALRELAAFIGYPHQELANYLAIFTPESALVAASAPARIHTARGHR